MNDTGTARVRPTRGELFAGLAAAAAWPVAVAAMLLVVQLTVAPAQQATAVRVSVFYGVFGWPVVVLLAAALPRLRHWWPDVRLDGALRAASLTSACAAVLGLCLILPRG